MTPSERFDGFSGLFRCYFIPIWGAFGWRSASTDPGGDAEGAPLVAPGLCARVVTAPLDYPDSSPVPSLEMPYTSLEMP